MPTYVYKCDNEHTFEVMQPMSDDALDTCEVCGAPAQRVLFAPAVHFKGSGFYTTDYARKGKKTGASESGSESSGDSKGSETKSSESKSDSASSNGSKSESKAAKSGD